MGLLDTVIGGVAGATSNIPIIGDAIGGATSAYQVGQQNRWDRQQSKDNRDFQERMSSTAAQRGVVDLKAAGLNPILAANRSASTPGGAQPGPSQNPVTTAINSALAIRRQRADIENIEAQTNKTKADTNPIEKIIDVLESLGLPPGWIKKAKDQAGNTAKNVAEDDIWDLKPDKDSIIIKNGVESPHSARSSSENRGGLPKLGKSKPFHKRSSSNRGRRGR